MPGACFGDVVRLFPMKNRHSNGRLTYMLNRHEKSRTIDIVHIPLRVCGRGSLPLCNTIVGAVSNGFPA
eukprot:6381711-Prymnesium_polylepis.1